MKFFVHFHIIIHKNTSAFEGSISMVLICFIRACVGDFCFEFSLYKVTSSKTNLKLLAYRGLCFAIIHFLDQSDDLMLITLNFIATRSKMPFDNRNKCCSFNMQSSTISSSLAANIHSIAPPLNIYTTVI